MGCDIHMFIEFKAGDGPWTADKNHKLNTEDGYDNVNEVYATGRHYFLFAALAGVRGDGPDAKGIPEDASELIKLACELYGDDGHSHSYSSIEEFRKALTLCDYDVNQKVEAEAFREDYNLSYQNLLAYMEKEQIRLKLDLESEKMLLGQDLNTEVEVRLVYYFDN